MSTPGYYVGLVHSDCILQSGLKSFWHADYAAVIRAVNKSEKVKDPVFPSALPDPKSTGVSFVLTDESGNEMLKNSRSLKSTTIPRRCLAKLQAAVNQLHAWAEDPRVPVDKREFCRKFALPDPKKDPDAYRITGGLFSRKLHVLWGYQKEGSSAFLPSSRLSAKWDDNNARKNIFKVCKGPVWRRIVRSLFKSVLITAAIGTAVYLGLYIPVRCPVHQCVVGNGVLCYRDRVGSCPRRCDLKGCNRHLDAKEKCNAHECTICHRMLPTSVGQNGICDTCYTTVIE